VEGHWKRSNDGASRTGETRDGSWTMTARTSVVADVATFIEDAGVAGGSTAWKLFRRRMADQGMGDKIVVVSEDGGMAPEFPSVVGIGDSALEDPAVLVTVRGSVNDSDATEQKAMEVYELLHGRRDVQLTTESNATTYYRVKARTPGPVFAGFDERGRPIHTVSFQCLRDAIPPSASL
jgi:hypothetical protein